MDRKPSIHAGLQDIAGPTQYDHRDLARQYSCRVRGLDTRVDAMIRVQGLWLSVQPLDMRAGTESALARVVAAFGAARPHQA